MTRPDNPVTYSSRLVDMVFTVMVKAGSALRGAARYLFYWPLAAHSLTRAESRSSTLPRLEGNLGFARFMAAARIVLFPHRIVQIWLLDFFRSYFGVKGDSDTFFFLTHNYYLSKYFTLRERVDCAINHYRHEGRNSGLAYHQAVYHSPGGMILWHRKVSGTRYSLNLQATDDYRHEGDLSILCLVDDARICRLSFTYVRGALFGIDADITMFVTRNQTDRSAELQRFRQDFKQNSPPYFCMAALCGIAMAHGIRTVCMIKDDAQIAYDARYAESFRNSYSAFWEVFGAEEIAARHAFKMSVPLDLTPITNVKHKNRAVARRQNWQQIMTDARQVILEDRLTLFPLPIAVEDSRFLPSAK